MQSLVVVLCLCLAAPASSEMQCLDEDGKSVDWYVMYKLPKLRSSNYLINNGLAYAFVTSSHPGTGWKLSERSVNDSLSLPGLLLSPLYLEDPNVFHVLYNDDPPSTEPSLTYGHTKGVVMARGTTGFWLVHSVPNFVTAPGPAPSGARSNYSYPRTAVRFGQSFLCISVNSTQFDVIGAQLMYNRPKIYSSNIPKSYPPKYLNLTAAAKGKFVKIAPWFRKANVVSSGGVKFISYAKSGRFNKELYADWLAPDLAADLAVETWSNGAGELPSNCVGKFKVMDVSDVRLQLDSSVSFKNSQDHSKWALSTKEQDGVVCVGDINRMVAQLKRGGGTVCFRNPKLWRTYNQSVSGLQPCPR